MSISSEELRSRLWRYRQQNWKGVQTIEWQKKIVEQQMNFDALPFLKETLNRFGFVASEMRYLDVGSGIGDYVITARKLGIESYGVEPDHIGIGSSESSLSIAKDRAENSDWFRPAVGEALPFEDGTFDLITMNQVLEHVQDVKQVLSEALRVLKSGGIILFNNPNYLSFYEPHYKILWFPLFPRLLANVYLHIRGRDPSFLTGINYVTRSGLSAILQTLACSFYDVDFERMKQRMSEVDDIRNPNFRKLARIVRWIGCERVFISLYLNFMVRGMEFVVKKN